MGTMWTILLLLLPFLSLVGSAVAATPTPHPQHRSALSATGDGVRSWQAGARAECTERLDGVQRGQASEAAAGSVPVTTFVGQLGSMDCHPVIAFDVLLWGAGPRARDKQVPASQGSMSGLVWPWCW